MRNLLGTGMIVAGLPLAFTLSSRARQDASQRTLGTIGLGLACAAVAAIAALMFWYAL